MNHNHKILHCPLNNGNHAWTLSRAERQIGLQSDLVIFQKGPFYENYDKFIDINGVSIPNEIKRINFLLDVIRKYDVINFNFGQTIWDHPFLGFNYLDLPILKGAGKKIIFTYQGDDARDRVFFARKFHTWLYSKNKKFSFYDQFLNFNRRIRIKKAEKYADHIFALNPDIMHVLPRQTQFQPYCINIRDFYPGAKQSDHSHKINIIHAPTNRLVKGTETIERIVKKLAVKYPINFEIIENQPNNKNYQKYRQADIAIDQLIIGWYGAFAAEMMACGVPVISYIRQSDVEKFVPFWKDIPIINASEESLESALKLLIENPKLRAQVGKKGHRYVHNYHNPLKIAAQTKKVYEKLCVA